MDIREQSPIRLVLSVSTGWLTYVSGMVAFGLGLLLIFGNNAIGNNNIAYKLIIGPIGVAAGLAMLLGPLKCVLTVDRSVGQLSIKKKYVVGLVPITKSITLRELNQFNVQHQTPFKLKSPAMKFKFISPECKAIFYSHNLHYNGKKGFFVQLAQTDAHKSDEEKLISLVASYINLPATTTARLMDSPNISKRLLYVAVYLVGGFVIAIGVIWFYYHIFHK